MFQDCALGVFRAGWVVATEALGIKVPEWAVVERKGLLVETNGKNG